MRQSATRMEHGANWVGYHLSQKERGAECMSATGYALALGYDLRPLEKLAHVTRFDLCVLRSIVPCHCCRWLFCKTYMSGQEKSRV